MTIWYLKIGNSRMVAWDGNRRYFEAKSALKNCRSLRRRLGAVDEVVSLSTVPKLTRQWQSLCRRDGIKLLVVSSKEITSRLAYRKGLGSDRALNILAARQCAPRANLVVFDCGTAVTVEFIDAHGRHRGGWIAAGPSLVANAMHDGTAQLPRILPVRLPSRRIVGRNTRECLQAGVSHTLSGLLSEAKRVGRLLFGASFQILVTGGWGSLLELDVNKIRVVKELSLLGLKFYRQEMHKSYAGTRVSRTSRRSKKSSRSR